MGWTPVGPRSIRVPGTFLYVYTIRSCLWHTLLVCAPAIVNMSVWSVFQLVWDSAHETQGGEATKNVRNIGHHNTLRLVAFYIICFPQFIFLKNNLLNHVL